MANFPFDTVGFDLDGTLVDTAPDLCRAVNHALATIARPALSEEATREVIGGGTRAMLTRALERTGGPVDEATFGNLYADLIAHYERHTSEHSAPYPGCLAALDALEARGCRLAVVTNKPEYLARKLLDELGMNHRFDCVLGGDTLGPGRSKPERDMLDEALRLCGGSRFAMVGDSSFDVKAARAAEVPVVVLREGYHDMPPEELGADALIGHFDELEAALAAL
uniref:HAD-IA family hydrolase n=1 Tax=Altererythrobacter segetis TaxID=1104773 RepID=UPI001408D005|nr:HAD-IA family hydrolase [Altererythrobacter segetis]